MDVDIKDLSKKVPGDIEASMSRSMSKPLTSDRSAHLKDFNTHGDDVKEFSQSKIAKLNRASRFEKLFPFYRMDVNGYSKRITEARE